MSGIDTLKDLIKRDRASSSIGASTHITQEPKADIMDAFHSIDAILDNTELDQAARDGIKRAIKANLIESNLTLHIKERLSILFEYEKNYLGLIKEFKEEIKFVGALQEDLRKERAKFFSDTLKEVSETLKDSQVSSEVASKWIQELVASYTKSLDFSSGLVEENTFDMVGEIRSFAKLSANKASHPQKNETEQN